MSTPYIGEIRMFAGNFAPVGWEFCDGQLLPISEYDALFALVGTTYGGDGQNTFAVPDLRSRVPIHQGQGAGLPNYAIGQNGGAESVTLTTQQLPAHTHPVNASANAADSTSPAGAVWAGQNLTAYTTSPTPTAMSPSALAAAGGNQPHDNMPPFVGLNFIISLFGIFPSQG